MKLARPPRKKRSLDETVALAAPPHDAGKGRLQVVEHLFQKLDEFGGGVGAGAADAVDGGADGQKLFLHRSVSRVKPPNEQLSKWMAKLYKAPAVRLASSGCIVSLIQPNTRRPGRTFLNPERERGKGNYNDGISYAAIVLLDAGRLPANEHDEASHICGHNRCVNVAHLCWEPLGLNAQRNECHRYDVPCVHVPRCLRFLPSDALEIKRRLGEYKKQK